MLYLEYLLWGYLIAWPVYIYLTYKQERQSVIEQPQKRIMVYRMTMLQMWLPTLMLLTLVYTGYLSKNNIGLQWHWNMANQIAVAGLLLFVGYSLLSIKQIKTQPESQEVWRKQLAHIKWFLPTTAKESRYFIFGLSISAGVCEELLYRGYLMQLLAGYLPAYGVVILSSLAFGLGHIYQGSIHVIRTSILGVVMALIYLATDSIIIPIMLHVLMDMQGGVISYLIFSNKQRPALTGKAC